MRKISITHSDKTGNEAINESFPSDVLALELNYFRYRCRAIEISVEAILNEAKFNWLAIKLLTNFGFSISPETYNEDLNKIKADNEVLKSKLLSLPLDVCDFDANQKSIAYSIVLGREIEADKLTSAEQSELENEVIKKLNHIKRYVV